jgi:hypothetical protein
MKEPELGLDVIYNVGPAGTLILLSQGIQAPFGYIHVECHVQIEVNLLWIIHEEENL